MEPISHFMKVVDTDYGRMAVNKYDTAQTGFYKHTRRAINHDELVGIKNLLAQLVDGPFDIVDCGAHIGTWGMFFKDMINLRTTHCFEPIPVYYQLIQETAKLNPASKMATYNLAVSDRAGMIAVPRFDWTKPTNFGGIELGKDQVEFIGQPRLPEPGWDIPVVSLDDHLELRRNRVKLLKIDVEGMENKVLTGAQEIISQDRPILFVEYIKSDQNELLDLFRSCNYTNITKMGTDFLCLPS